jgi:uncharacterized protein (TIGR02266 family)
MAEELADWVARFKALDLARGRGLSAAEAREWLRLKEAIEHATSCEECPPSSQRASLRVPTSFEARFEDPNGFRQAYLRNISEGGVYIESGDRFEMGDRFVLHLVVEDPPIAIAQRVQVVWVNVNPSPGSGLEPGVGVAFLDLSPDKKRQIKAIVHNRLDALARERA